MSAPMNRRDFVHRLPVVSAVAWAGAATLPLAGCAGAAYLVPQESGGRLLVPTSALAEAGGVFVAVPGGDRPVYLHRTRGGVFVALLARCTHRGCQPEPVADRLVCPCHGSEYDLDGNVLQGPAERPLTRYDASVEGDHAVIWIRGRSG